MPRQAYYAARAIAERRQAQAATDPRVATVHAELSARYEALAADPNLDLPVSQPRDAHPPVPEWSTVVNPTD